MALEHILLISVIGFFILRWVYKKNRKKIIKIFRADGSNEPIIDLKPRDQKTREFTKKYLAPLMIICILLSAYGIHQTRKDILNLRKNGLFFKGKLMKFEEFKIALEKHMKDKMEKYWGDPKKNIPGTHDQEGVAPLDMPAPDSPATSRDFNEGLLTYCKYYGAVGIIVCGFLLLMSWGVKKKIIPDPGDSPGFFAWLWGLLPRSIRNMLRWAVETAAKLYKITLSPLVHGLARLIRRIFEKIMHK